MRLLLLGLLLSFCKIAYADPAIAFFYGSNPPWDELQSFDLVVVEPDHVPDPGIPVLADTRLAAYVSVGEVNPSRTYAKQIPKEWLIGENRDWGSRIVDQSQPDWPRFFAETVIGPLWRAGYRDLFLDTLDSYQLAVRTPEARAKQEAGLVAVIEELKRRYPEVRLIFNRGFEILDRTHDNVFAVAAESLFQGYDTGKSSYRSVPETDRTWLLEQLNKAHNVFGLPVIAIEYVPSAQRDLARATAKKIEALGFIPWVATPDLATLGVGLVETIPRRLLMIHSPQPNEYAVRLDDIVRLATMPINYLGYAAEYADPRTLPPAPKYGRYAGVVIWLTAPLTADDSQRLTEWLAKCVAEKIPVAIINQLAGILDTPFGKSLGVQMGAGPEDLRRINILQQAAMIGFERPPHPHLDEFNAISVSPGKPLLTLGKGKAREVAAAITPWGGYATSPYALATLPNDEYRWVIDPFAFFREALQLPDMPVPDVTTESGRRMLLIHMDGDGFVSRSELPGNPFAGEVLRDRVVRKYPLPMTISVIEAEISPKGLYPQYSAQLEKVAREVFSAPNVEIASHSYSHPFIWRKAASSRELPEGEGEGGYSLPIPGYRFDMQREIEGSIHYIEERLAPPGKKVTVFLWTGDCNPGYEALEWTQRLGVMNMNGGETIATRSQPTLTQVEGLGMERQGLFQVFAPNQNENRYTNNWKGPYYGFERVIETFDLTERPRRLKPIDIYFHTYLTTKLAGMKSLDKIFDYALAQETTPVFASEYARKVVDFQHLAIARSATGWRVRGAVNLRTLRAPVSLGEPDMRASRALAGFKRYGSDNYLHLASTSAEIAFAATESAEPILVSANARIENSLRDEDAVRWQLAGHVPLQFDLANVARCVVRADGRKIAPTRRDGAIFHYQLTAHAARPLETLCRH